MTYSNLNKLLESDYARMKEGRQQDIDAVRRAFDPIFDLQDSKVSIYYTGGFGWDITTDDGLRASVSWDKTEYVNQATKTLNLYPKVKAWIKLPEHSDNEDATDAYNELLAAIESTYDVEWKISKSIRKDPDGILVYVSGEAKSAVRSRPDPRADERNSHASHMSPRDRYDATPGARWQAARQQRARDAGMDNFGGHDANYRS